MTDMVGQRMRLRMGHLFQTVTFSAEIVKDDGDTVCVRIPRKVRELQWTEFPRPIARFPRAVAEQSLVSKVCRA